MTRKPLFMLISILGLTLAACGAEAERSQVLRVMTHDSFAVADDVVAAFEAQYDVKVEFLASGDTGAALNKAILSVGNPIADVFYGGGRTVEQVAKRGRYLNAEMVQEGVAVGLG